MTHRMKLQDKPFRAISEGRKDIELRLYDEKRRAIRIGDRIEFRHAGDPERGLLVRVTALHPFPSFAALYASLPLDRCGYAPEEIPSARPEDMEAYYPSGEQEKYGVLGIEFRRLCALEGALPVYLQEGPLCIRAMLPKDAEAIAQAEVAQGWLNASPEKYNTRLRDQAAGRAFALVAEWNGNPVGYINLYLHPNTGPFAGRGWPEIVDFGVLKAYRRLGIGHRLMEEAERLAGTYADHVWLGVGLHSGYGAAQRMYVKRGYVPDGSGVWYRDSICEPYASCANDDDLVLYLSKALG